MNNHVNKLHANGMEFNDFSMVTFYVTFHLKKKTITKDTNRKTIKRISSTVDPPSCKQTAIYIGNKRSAFFVSFFLSRKRFLDSKYILEFS